MIRKLFRSVAERYRSSRWFHWTCDVVTVAVMFLVITIVHGLGGLVAISRLMQMFSSVQSARG